MLNRLPKDPGDLAELMAQMSANVKQTARALGVSPRTVRRWLASGQAVRSTRLALWWLASGQAVRSTRLALWWLSHAAYDAWDSEMRTRAGLMAQLDRQPRIDGAVFCWWSGAAELRGQPPHPADAGQ